jgi:hypothetical protein
VKYNPKLRNLSSKDKNMHASLEDIFGYSNITQTTMSYKKIIIDREKNTESSLDDIFGYSSYDLFIKKELIPQMEEFIFLI